MPSQSGAIYVSELTKCYYAKAASSTFLGSLKALVKPLRKEIQALKKISFSIAPGERVAFIGPNGAGKSTTLKILTGILYPTSGEATVIGLVPWEQRIKLSRQIGSIFGQRSQLWYHLPAGDTFDLLARVYEIDNHTYQERRAGLVQIFALGELLSKPVRQLSLGERMRCEIVSSLLHQPKVLFLDEPTIGLDVTAKAVIRKLIRRTSESEGTTVLLTSHDTGDIEGVCDRVMVINEGTLILDQALTKLRQDYIRRKLVTVQSAEETLALHLDGVNLVKAEPYRTVFEIDTEIASIDLAIEALLKKGGINDLTVEDPPLEEIIKRIYADMERSV